MTSALAGLYVIYIILIPQADYFFEDIFTYDNIIICLNHVKSEQ